MEISSNFVAFLENMNFNHYLNDLRSEKKFLSVSKKAMKNRYALNTFGNFILFSLFKYYFWKTFATYMLMIFFCLSQLDKIIFEVELWFLCILLFIWCLLFYKVKILDWIVKKFAKYRVKVLYQMCKLLMQNQICKKTPIFGFWIGKDCFEMNVSQ